MKRIAYLMIAALVASIPLSCSQKEQSGGKDVTILCATSGADEITVNSATLKGTVLISDASSEQMEVWFLIDKDASSLFSNGIKVSAGKVSAKGGTVSAVVTDLEPETTYYFVVCASIDGKQASGEVSSFVTLSHPKEVIITAEASNITEASALLYGYAYLPEVMAGVSFGIICSTSENPSLGVAVESKELDSNNKFFSSITGLQPATTYYYKAYLKAEGFYREGEVKSFTTVDFAASVSTVPATDVGLFSATIDGKLTVEGGVALTWSVWFLYSTNAESLEDLKSSGSRAEAILGNDGAFSYALSSLNYNTTYYYVACAKVHDWEYYGEVKSFTTKDFAASVSTAPATDVGLFSATIDGKLTVEGSDALTRSVWFLYSASAGSLEELKSSGTIARASLGSDGAFSYALSSLNYNSTYYYVACAKVHDRDYYGEVKSFTTKDFETGAVDLGLSVKWSGCNIGASKVEKVGLYYAWGETTAKSDYDWERYKWCYSSYKKLTKYNTDSSYGYVDNKTVLEAEDDVANVKLGGNWRMPTEAEWTELIENCTWTWMTVNGVKGRLVTSKKNGNSIFLPVAGIRQYGVISYSSFAYYWSSSLYTDDPSHAWGIGFYVGNVTMGGDGSLCERCLGRSIRPVTE